MSDWRMDEWQAVKVWVRARGFEAPGARPGEHRYALIGVTHHRPNESPADVILRFAASERVAIQDVVVLAINHGGRNDIAAALEAESVLPAPGSPERQR